MKMLTQGIFIGLGFMLGVLLMRRPDRRSERMAQFLAVCKFARELGYDNGQDLFGLDALAGPPSAYVLDPKFDPAGTPAERETSTRWGARVAFSEGRRDGWWAAAQLEAEIGIKEIAEHLRRAA